jgi:putative oxidoreductase
MAPFVGCVEIIFGLLILVGLLTRLSTLLVDIAVAIYSTKIVIFSKNGFWGTLHEARTDVSMLLGLLFLLIGGGARSLDARFMERRTGTHA